MRGTAFSATYVSHGPGRSGGNPSLDAVQIGASHGFLPSATHAVSGPRFRAGWQIFAATTANHFRLFIDGGC